MASRRSDGANFSGMGVTDALSTAISMGAPTYNMGDHRGCYDLYKRTAEVVLDRPMLAGTDRQLLQQGIREAQMAS